jgi:alkylation response protein AidB-like acyl-CoA dehydrogenase
MRANSHEFIEKLARHGLRGLRFPKKYGGRGLPWTAEVVAEEEIGVLGMALGCAFVMTSIVGEALNGFGTEDQRERYLRPMITGTKIPEEGLTSPGGIGLLRSHYQRRPRRRQLYFERAETVRGRRRRLPTFCTVHCNTDPKALHQRISMFIVEKGRGRSGAYLRPPGVPGNGGGEAGLPELRVPRKTLWSTGVWRLIFDRMMIRNAHFRRSLHPGAGAAPGNAIRYSDRQGGFRRKNPAFQAVSFMIADAITRLDAARD